MRGTLHRAVPEAVGDALLGWLPEAEHAVSAREVADASVEVADGGRPVGVALLVEGHPTLSGAAVVAACAGEARAATELAAMLAPRAARAGRLEVSGPTDVAQPVAGAVAAEAGGTVEVVMEQRLMVTGAPVEPAGVSGRARRVEAADRRVVAGWLDGFAVEALRAPASGVEHWLEQLEDPDWQLWLWEVDGVAVSLVNGRRTTPVSARIGPVYTPPEQRGNGYASALTAHVTSTLLAAGNERVTLFTDVANSSSNALYARVGFVDVAAHGSWLVTAEAG